MTESFTMTATAGVLVRGYMRRSVLRIAWECECEVDIDEDRGVLDSLFRFRFRGDPDSIRKAEASMQAFKRKLAKERDA